MLADVYNFLLGIAIGIVIMLMVCFYSPRFPVWCIKLQKQIHIDERKNGDEALKKFNEELDKTEFYRL